MNLACILYYHRENSFPRHHVWRVVSLPTKQGFVWHARTLHQTIGRSTLCVFFIWTLPIALSLQIINSPMNSGYSSAKFDRPNGLGPKSKKVIASWETNCSLQRVAEFGRLKRKRQIYSSLSWGAAVHWTVTSGPGARLSMSCRSTDAESTRVKLIFIYLRELYIIKMCLQWERIMEYRTPREREDQKKVYVQLLQVAGL